MNQTISYYDYYKDKINDEYYTYFKSRYARFIEEIEKEIINNSIIAEYGCGTCNTTRALFDKHGTFCVYHGIDNNLKMLELAELNLKSINPHNVNFQKGDIRYYIAINGNITHRHGVLEHFNDCDIKSIVSNQKDRFDKVIHYVPSNKYNYKSLGDERLLSPKEWEIICRPDEIIEFNDGYDLILKWEGNKWKGF